MAKTTLKAPIGRFGWAHLNTPDTKFNPDGVYRVELVLDPSPEVEAFIARLDEMNEAAFRLQQTEADPKYRKTMRKRDLYETDEDTGKVTVKFKGKAGGERRDGSTWTWKPPLFDSVGNPFPRSRQIGSGTLGRVAFTVDTDGWFMPATKEAGISLKLAAAQIVELVEFGARDASGYGFDSVEDGFVATDDVDDFGSDDEAVVAVGVGDEEYPDDF